MKYLKDFLKIIVFVAIMYLPLSWLSFQGSLNTIDKIAEEETLTKLRTVQNTTQMLLEKNEMQEACRRLDADILARNIATYYLAGPDSTCNKPAGLDALPPIAQNNKAVSFVVRDIPLTFIKFQTNQYRWAISVVTPQKMGVMERLKTNKALREALIKDFLLVIYTVFAFILCAVLIFAESIQNKYKKAGRDPAWLKVLSKIFGFLQLNDLKIIKSATTALVKQTDDLNKDLDLLQTSLEYSILNEIKKNNHQVPYTFFGTAAKVDINGYSKVVATNNSAITQLMTAHLENYGCELLQRYEGLFEKTIGDEIVVVFKGTDSALRATAFCRDLMYEFSQIPFQIDHESRQFTLKSAIASSDITFSKRAAGYGFLGDALTLTTRLMDAVKIKDKNILSITQDQSNAVASLILTPQQTENFQFKNMPDQKGYQIEIFKLVEDGARHTELLNYFRADHHIIFLLNQIQLRPLNTDIILDALLRINVRQATPEMISTWMTLLEKSLKPQPMSPSQIAKIIMLGKNLIPPHQWTADCTEALLKLPRTIEGRINASVIDVLMVKNIKAFQNEDQKTFLITNDPSGRTQANILMFKALEHLDDQIFIDLINMIRSSQSNISKSGIYAACQVIEYYKMKNPAALETYPSYLKTLDLLKRIKESKKIKLSDRLQERLQFL